MKIERAFWCGWNSFCVRFLSLVNFAPFSHVEFWFILWLDLPPRWGTRNYIVCGASLCLLHSSFDSNYKYKQSTARINMGLVWPYPLAMAVSAHKDSKNAHSKYLTERNKIDDNHLNCGESDWRKCMRMCECICCFQATMEHRKTTKIHAP